MNLLQQCTTHIDAVFHPFLVDTSINRKNIRFISYLYFHCIPREKKSILTLLNAGLFQTFDIVEINMTSQLSLSAKITLIFNQSKQTLYHHSNKY